VVDVPAARFALEGATETVKSRMLTVTVVLCVALAEVPVTVSG
jgi:hypothetical protein